MFKTTICDNCHSSFIADKKDVTICAECLKKVFREGRGKILIKIK